MQANRRIISSATRREAKYPPQTLKFEEHYEFRHGVKPPQTKPGEYSTSNNTSLAIVISFLTSTALAIGVNTSGVLDRFGKPVKQFVQSGLNYLSVILGTIAAGSYLSNYLETIREGLKE